MPFKVEMTADVLESLAAERKEETVEGFSPNDFYGNATVLKQYCGLSQDYAIQGVLPHSPCISSKIWEIEKTHPFRARFLLSETQREVYRKQTDRDLYVIGSPLLYAERLLDQELDEIRRHAKGTLVFPAHSTHHITSGFDHERFIERIKGVHDSEQPITVCLYWRDIQLGRHQEYLDAGLNCTTAGHMFDKQFHFRLLKIIASHRLALTNRMGASSLYAAAFGLPVRFTNLEVELMADHERFRREISPKDLPIVESFMAAASLGGATMLTTQQQLGLESMGSQNLLTPEAMKDLFLSVESIQHGKPQFTFPGLALEQPISKTLRQIKERMIAYPRNKRGTIPFAGHPVQFFDLKRFHEEAQKVFVEQIYQFNSSRSNPVIVDCGTNLGLLPIYYAKHFPNARIVAFEADPIKARIAENNLQEAGVTNTRLIPKAVWLDNGTVPFVCQTDLGEPTVVQVPAVKLSDFVGDQTIDLLRLNVAGAEFHIIRDSLSQLPHVRHLITEVRQLPGNAPHLADLLCMLRETGFDCHLLEHWESNDDRSENVKGVTIFAWKKLADENTTIQPQMKYRTATNSSPLPQAQPTGPSLPRTTNHLQPC